MCVISCCFFVTQVAEGFITLSTLVRLFSCECHFMLFLVTHEVEVFITVLALVRLFSSVSFHVVSCCLSG